MRILSSDHYRMVSVAFIQIVGKSLQKFTTSLLLVI